MKKTFKAGFTLIELLVVISIIGMLAGLLLPAVQSAREMGRRTVCLNNQKNIALAFNTMQSTKGKFPTWRSYIEVNDPNVGRDVVGWTVLVFPYMEQTQAYDSLQNNGYIQADGNYNSMLENLTIPSFKCQSAASESNNNFVANCGIGDNKGSYDSNNDWAVASYAKSRYNGMLLDGAANCKGLSIDDVKDGVTNTVLISENVQAGNLFDVREHQLGFCLGLVLGDSGNINNDVNTRYGEFSTNDGVVAIDGSGRPQRVNKLRDEIVSSAFNRNVLDNDDQGNWAYARMSSLHPGVVVAAMADSSTRVINENIDREVLASVMAPNDKKSLYGLDGYVLNLDDL